MGFCSPFLLPWLGGSREVPFAFSCFPPPWPLVVTGSRPRSSGFFFSRYLFLSSRLPELSTSGSVARGFFPDAENRSFAFLFPFPWVIFVLLWVQRLPMDFTALRGYNLDGVAGARGKRWATLHRPVLCSGCSAWSTYCPRLLRMWSRILTHMRFVIPLSTPPLTDNKSIKSIPSGVQRLTHARENLWTLLLLRSCQ